FLSDAARGAGSLAAGPLRRLLSFEAKQSGAAEAIDGLIHGRKAGAGLSELQPFPGIVRATHKASELGFKVGEAGFVAETVTTSSDTLRRLGFVGATDAADNLRDIRAKERTYPPDRSGRIRFDRREEAEGTQRLLAQYADMLSAGKDAESARRI